MFNITPHQQETNQYYLYGTIVIAIVALIIIWVKNRLKAPRYKVDYDFNYDITGLYFGIYKRKGLRYKHLNIVYDNRYEAQVCCKLLNDKQLIK